MEGHIKQIGGEQWFDTNLFDDKLDNFEHLKGIFLSGGQSSIQFILEDIDIEHDEYILMPAYLCPSILHNFKRLNIKYEFYKINKDLSIDLNDIKNKMSKFKIRALFLINYFGFYHDKQTIDYLKQLQKQHIIIIEDAVQMLWFSKKRQFFGDYIFNSYRKFLPIDGSIILCNKNKRYNFKKDSYYENVNLARVKKTAFQKFGVGNEREFLSLYEKAEEEYYKRQNIIGMAGEAKKKLSKVDYKFIFDKRKENYCYLYDNLIENNKIQIIYDKKLIADNSVLGLPILIKNRDEIRKKLRKFNIYCAVHWDIVNEGWASEYINSRYISRNIITIPIDQRYEISDMKRLVEVIQNFVIL